MGQEKDQGCEGKGNPVGWFEIPVSDINRARKFYQAVFNTEFESMEMNGVQLAVFPMVHGGSGAAGALVQGGCAEPATTGTLVYFMTDTIDAGLERVTKNGGKVMMPRTAIGEHGFVAHFQDTEGNKVAFHAMK